MPRGRTTPSPESRECPFCKEEVKATALRCKHCQAALVPTRPEHGGECPFCKEAINVEALRCKHCRADVAGSRGMIIYGSEALGGSGDAGAIIVYDRPTPGDLSTGLPGGIIINWVPASGFLRDPASNAIIIHAAGGVPR